MRNGDVTGNTLSWGDFQKSIAGTLQESGQTPELSSAMADWFMESALTKGLGSTGTQAIAGVTTGGDATTMESLYDEVVSTELNMKDHATIWNDLEKVPVLEEYVQKVDMNSYGGGRRLGFINSQTPTGGVTAKNPNLKRNGIPVRWVGGRFQTFTSLNSQRTLGLNVDPAVGNASELNSEARLQAMILNASELCWHGDNDVNPLEPFGIIPQVREAYSKKKPTRINMKGLPITRDFVPKLRQMLRNAGGGWTHFYGAPTMYADLELSLLDSIRRADGDRASLGMYSDEAIIRDLGGNRATAKLREDQFLETLGDDSFSADPDAPIRPSAVAAAAATATAANFWGSYLAQATYYYSVCAVGINGRSAVRTATASVLVGTTEKVNLTITNADAGTVFFEVYRGTTASNRQYLGRISATGKVAGDTVVFVDDGEFYPGTSQAVALTIKAMKRCKSIHICQLLPTTKVELPGELVAKQGGWICGFTPRVLNEEHNIVLENVGRYVA
ncbi:hypothetical protein EON83_11035 [bacterium]|nr:MAG: hypothetical protein EON83_11035 [bacterium]